MEEFFTANRSSWGVVMRSSWGFTTLHEVAVVLIAAAVLALVAFVVARTGLRGLPPHYNRGGWGQRGLTLLEAIIVLLIVAVVVLAIFVLV